MARLVIVVPATRDYCGRATILAADGHALLAPFRLLATASVRVAARHGNPSCDPQLPFGHPAAGSYVVAGSLPPGSRHRRQQRYGRLGALLLQATGGEAMTATTNGRGLLALHGGPSDRKGRLRPTRGGLRIADRDLATLVRTINRCNAAGDPLSRIDLVAVASEPVDLDPKRDRRGGRRIALAAPRRGQTGLLEPRRSPKSRAGLVRMGALLVPALLGRSPAPVEGDGTPRDPGRRAFLATVALLAAGLSAAGCNAAGQCVAVADDAGPGSDGGVRYHEYCSGGGYG